MVPNDQRAMPTQPGHGGPLLGQDHGSGSAAAPLPAATIASACSFKAAASATGLYVLAEQGTPQICWKMVQAAKKVPEQVAWDPSFAKREFLLEYVLQASPAGALKMQKVSCTVHLGRTPRSFSRNAGVVLVPIVVERKLAGCPVYCLTVNTS